MQLSFKSRFCPSNGAHQPPAKAAAVLRMHNGFTHAQRMSLTRARRGVAAIDRAPIILPAPTNLFFGCTRVVGGRDEGQCSLDSDHDDVLDRTGYTALPKEREDFVEERAVAEDTGDALEPVPLAEKGINDVDL